MTPAPSWPRAPRTYDLSGEVNPAFTTAGGNAGGSPTPIGSPCDIKIEGVAPGASLAVMKVFGSSNLAFDSEILQGLEYAVNTDHVNILSESFGGNPVPNPGLDPIAVFDQQATADGVTVVASTGDAGITNTIGSPATNSAVISAAASTSYRLYAQTSSYLYERGSGGWESDNVSAFSSSGTGEYGPGTVDVIAPAEDGWADCSSNTTTFTECADIYQGSNPQPIVAFGGTSESCPLTAGVAALVIEAYRSAHGGAVPSPAVVKRIIMSSADDISAPGDEQGAGMVDAQRAVQTALAYKAASTATGGLVYSPNSIALTGQPGAAESVPVTVTNTRSSAQEGHAERAVPVRPDSGYRGPWHAGHHGIGDRDLSGRLAGALRPHHLYRAGAPGPAPLPDSRGTPTAPTARRWSGEDLFDPAGEMAAQSSPQGEGAGFGQVEVSNPAAGTWTLVVFSTQFVATEVLYTGNVSYAESTQTFQRTAVTGQLIAVGGTVTFHVPVMTPTNAGDTSESVTFGSAAAPSSPLGTVPVTLRALVPVTPSSPGDFNGTLTGGNARMGFYGQELSYQFDVPPGVHDLEAQLIVNQPGYTVEGFLVDPNDNPVDVQDERVTSGSGTATTCSSPGSTRCPVAGTWTSPPSAAARPT